MYDMNTIINKLQYGLKLEKLCYRILKTCVVQNNTTIQHPAQVTSTRKSMFIEINLNNTFFKTENHVIFALMHEALHIAFGHMFIDVGLYNHEKLNIVLDGSINPYLLKYINKKDVSTILDTQPDTIISGFKHIYEKSTWEHMYNNYVQQEDEPEDKEQHEDDPEEKEQHEDEPEEKEETNNNEENQEETKDEKSEETNSSGEQDNTEEGDTDDSPDGPGNTDVVQDTEGFESGSGGDRESDTSGSGTEVSNDTPRSRNSNDKQQSQVTFDNHAFAEAPSKALERVFNEIVIEGIKDLSISIGSELGQSLVKGLPFYQTKIQKWKRELSKAVLKAIKIRGTESTWKRPNRRNSSNMPIAGKRKLYYPSLGVLVDCSGSMLPYVKHVLNHVANISNATGGIDYLIGGDTRKLIDAKNVTKKKLQTLELKGYGGTMLKDMLLELGKKPIDILIIITDMELMYSDIETIIHLSKKISTILCVPKYAYNDKNIKAHIIEIGAEDI